MMLNGTVAVEGDEQRFNHMWPAVVHGRHRIICTCAMMGLPRSIIFIHPSTTCRWNRPERGSFSREPWLTLLKVSIEKISTRHAFRCFQIGTGPSAFSVGML